MSMSNIDQYKADLIKKVKDQFKDKVLTGTDAKQLQYEEFAVDLCYKNINLTDILQSKLKSESKDSNCLVINIEKDVIRYKSIVSELQKIGMTNFVHLKATYWKEKKNMLNDLKFILEFLRNFQVNKDGIDGIDGKYDMIDLSELKMNDFSEFNDPNIYIQDGPLACYCSHVRSMIYGYTNFSPSQYTIIIEDDVFISNTEKIEKYIKEVPEDWDIILLNSMPLNIKYDSETWYKMNNTFHSTHFYIIRNSALPFIFQNIYPIYDQIDILIAKLYDKLNIYNIIDTVYQKNFSTNTQNNLNAIFNSPNYHGIRAYLNSIKTSTFLYLEYRLPNNTVRNGEIVEQIFFDVIYNFIVNNFNYEASNYYNDNIEPKTTTEVNVNFRSNENEDTYMKEIEDLYQHEEFKQIYHDLYIVINSCMKGKNVHYQTISLMKDIMNIIDCFELHNTNTNLRLINTNELNLEIEMKLHAYSYGSTANTYLCQIETENETSTNKQMILKVYNKNLRWKCENHDDSFQIFQNELNILNKLTDIYPANSIPRTPILIDVNSEKMFLIMNFLGTSLFEKFILPKNWKKQINNIFDYLTLHNIEYPEFNLKNILVLDNKISFVDFGLARFNQDNHQQNVINKNQNHAKIFIEIIEKLKDKMSILNEHQKNQKYILYQTFINNMKLENKYPYNIF